MESNSCNGATVTGTPVLSIVMPVFNHPTDLKEMIESVLANGFQDWELLAVDDGSEAETLSILQTYAEQDARIHFTPRQELPKGAPTCRNIGLRQAVGKYIIFFDSDDYIVPDCLAQRVRELGSHPELDFMVFRSATFHDNQLHPEASKLNFGYRIYNDDLAAFCARTLPFVVVNNIYRRSSLLSKGILWNTRLLSLQDAQFNLDCILSGMRYDYASCPPDYGYRIDSAGSVSKKIASQRHCESNLYATEQFYQLIQSRYGHRYDDALLRGVLFIYMKVAREGMLKDFNVRLAAIVRQHSPKQGRMFMLQIKLAHFLAVFLPLTIARRIPFLSYLVWYRKHEQWVVRQQEELERTPRPSGTKRVSVIIVTHNSEKDIYECVESIKQYADIPLSEIELVVVDNNSLHPEPMFQRIRELWGEDAILIQNTKNGGYGQGNNVGIRNSSAPVILIMNPDVRLYEPVFQKVLSAFDKNEKLSMYGMRQMYSPTQPSMSSVLWTTRMNGYLWTLFTAISSRTNWYVPSKMYLSGACFFVRRSMFEAVGLFDETNFMYGEEDDIHFRLMQKYGAQMVYDASLHYLHLITERVPTLDYQMKLVDSSIRLNEKNGFPKKKTLQSYIQHANAIIARETLRQLLGKKSQTLQMYKEWKQKMEEML